MKRGGAKGLSFSLCHVAKLKVCNLQDNSLYIRNQHKKFYKHLKFHCSRMNIKKKSVFDPHLPLRRRCNIAPVPPEEGTKSVPKRLVYAF